MAVYKLKYGKDFQRLDISEHNVLQVIEGQNAAGLRDVAAEVIAAVEKPVDSPPLRQVIAPKDKVAIIVSDVTRGWIKYSSFLPALVDYLNNAGVPDRQISLVVALGAHRLHTPEENGHLFGNLAERVEIVQATALDDKDYVFFGRTTYGTEVFFNKKVADADKVILTGGVVYHFMAGYGGGRKSVIPGVSGYETIQQNHKLLLYPEGSPECLNLKDCASGKTAGNPMHEDMMEIAGMLKPDFLVNFVFNPQGEHAGVFAGHYITAWEKACSMVDQIYGVRIAKQADIVVASCGGFPKDINLYQTSKTIDNASRAVKPGGVVILLSECSDIKEPSDFAEWFNLPTKQDMERELRKNFTVPGYAALWEVEKATAATYIMVTLPGNADLVKKVGMIPVASLDEAMSMALKLKGNPDIILMPQGANTLPILS